MVKVCRQFVDVGWATHSISGSLKWRFKCVNLLDCDLVFLGALREWLQHAANNVTICEPAFARA
jgi:hypothetical protein